jgi:S-adenosylmethionine decarboxylase
MKKINYKKSLEILVDFLGCDFNLVNFQSLYQEIKSILEKNKIKILKENYHLFNKNNGATIVFILANSHLSLHTWPEKQLINLDLFICNFKANYNKKIMIIYQQIKNLLKPQKIIFKKITRIT